MAAVVVGVDVSKDHLDVHLHPTGEHSHLPPDTEGLDELIRWVVPAQPTVVALEATGASSLS